MIAGQRTGKGTSGHKRFIILTRTIHFEVFEVEGRQRDNSNAGLDRGPSPYQLTSVYFPDCL